MGKGESEEEGGNSNQAVLFILPFPPPSPFFLGKSVFCKKGPPNHKCTHSLRERQNSSRHFPKSWRPSPCWHGPSRLKRFNFASHCCSPLFGQESPVAQICTL